LIDVESVAPLIDGVSSRDGSGVSGRDGDGVKAGENGFGVNGVNAGVNGNHPYFYACPEDNHFQGE